MAWARRGDGGGHWVREDDAHRERLQQPKTYGAGTISFVRMTGAAIGTGVLAITLEHRTAYHADHLAATQTPHAPCTVRIITSPQ